MQYLPEGFEPACKRTEYWLVVNLMRDRAESQRGFGPFRSHADALAFHDAEMAAEPYDDDGTRGYGAGMGRRGTFRKSFRRGSELEWMNPLHESEREQIGCMGHGVHAVVKYYDDPSFAAPFRASVDTLPKGGDAKQAPCVSKGSAVAATGGETPNTDMGERG